MAEVLEPGPGAAEGAEAPAVETPGWQVPEDSGAQVGASRGTKGAGGFGGPGGGGGLRADLYSEAGESHIFKRKIQF